MAATTLEKRKNGNGGSFPSVTNDFFGSKFFSPSWNEFMDNSIKTPLANIKEGKSEFKLDMSVPGLKREDFKINVEDGVLTISAEKKEEKKEEDENYTRREFEYNSFNRSFTLPENVAEEKINAKYEDGMLHVSIPKKEASPAKQ